MLFPHKITWILMPQVPAVPCQRPNDAYSVSNHPWMNDLEPSDDPKEKGIPILITWNHGGTEISVEGSWDNWSSRYLPLSSINYIMHNVRCHPHLTDSLVWMFWLNILKNLYEHFQEDAGEVRKSSCCVDGLAVRSLSLQVLRWWRIQTQSWFSLHYWWERTIL